MLFSKNLNVLALAIASSRAHVVSSLLEKKREQRRELLLRGMEQRMDLTKAERAEDEAGVDPNTGADVGDLRVSDGEVEEEIDDEGRILKPDDEEDPSCRKCVGEDACVDVLLQPLDNDIGCQSCRGERVCSRLLSGCSIGEHSCIGYKACYGCGTSGDIGEKSCSGNQACNEANALIKDSSCNAPDACLKTGSNAQGYVGEKSCNAEGACAYAGFGLGNGGVTIGSNSCNAKGACIFAGSGSGLGTTIGSNSCNAYYACAGRITGDVIDPNTCNKPCECCGSNSGIDCTNLPKCPQFSV